MTDRTWDGKDISSQPKKPYNDQAAWNKEVLEREADKKLHGGKSLGQQVNENLKKVGK